MEDRKEMRIVTTLFSLLVSVVLLISCSARRSEPVEGTMDMSDPEVQKGEMLFNQYCHKCHPSGEAGMGPALNINPAPKFVKAFQVRHGLGVMPSFKKEEISKDDLDAILLYLKKLKHKG